jgi:hypothetical protein
MKKIIQSLFLFAGAALLFVSCNNKGASSDPKAVLVEFMKRLSEKDIDGAAKLATKDSKAALDMMKKAIDMGEKMKGDAKSEEEDPTAEFKDVEIGEAKINGETALVPFRSKKEKESIDFPLKKEDGAWKVDFSMSTLMKMGKDKASQDGGMDGMNESGEDVNVTAEDIQKSMQSVDSLMKDPKTQEAMKALEKLKQE